MFNSSTGYLEGLLIDRPNWIQERVIEKYAERLSVEGGKPLRSIGLDYIHNHAIMRPVRAKNVQGFYHKVWKQINFAFQLQPHQHTRLTDVAPQVC